MAMRILTLKSHLPTMIIFLVLVALLTLPACNSLLGAENPTPSASPLSPTATEPIQLSPTPVLTETPSIPPGELEVGIPWDVDNSPEVAHYEWLARSLEKDYPGTKVVFIDNSASQRASISSRTLSGNPLDLDFLFDGLNPLTYQWVEDGYVLNLTPYLNQKIDGQGTWNSSINKKNQPAMLYDSKIYGVPDQVYYWVIFYNQTLFSQWDIETPATFTELLATCPTIQQHSNRQIAPIAISGQFELYAGMWFDQLTQRACGAEKVQSFLSGTNNTPIADEACIQTALESLSQMKNNQCLATDWQVLDATTAQDTFIKGEAAMILMGTWMTADLGSIASNDYEYAVIPFPSLEGGEGNQNGLFGRAMIWNIPAESDQPDLSLEFLKRLTSLSTATRAVEQMGIISTINNAPITEKPTGMDLIAEFANHTEAEIIMLHYGIYLNEQLAHTWYQPAIQVLAGQITPLKAINQLEQGLINTIHNNE
jgi:raffinose/stachyose/melibiose transport system substrate-binding protein